VASVRLEHVKKVYDGGFVAVHDLSLEIQDKEFVVLVGPSGCGKSTTLRMVAGLEEVSSGTISIDGRVVNDVPPKDRDIAMVFQNYALYPHMTVFENMAFGLQLRKFPKEEIRRRVEEAAQLLELTDVLERKPKALSGGQRQRVAVGRAIVRKPKVFLFDEPLSNLDAKLRVQMRTEISRLHQRLGATMIYVTHDQTEAMTMADRIVLMKDGHVQQVDSPLGIYGGPKNRFTAGFIGSPAMNFLDGSIERRRGLVFCEKGGPVTLAIPRRLQARLNSWVGHEVVLGIRPEHLSRTTGRSGTTLNITVDVVEPMGNEVYVYFVTRPDGPQHVARLPADELPQRGKRLTLSVDAGKLYFFDKRTEMAI
jgi:multiple sugar transport system ATP-binding protein